MVLGKLPVPGRPTNLDYIGQVPTVLAVGAGGGCLDIFSLVYHFSFLSPSLWEAARYRLKYCLKGPLSPKQPTNQSIRSRYNLDELRMFVSMLVYTFSLRKTRVLTATHFQLIIAPIIMLTHEVRKKCPVS